MGGLQLEGDSDVAGLVHVREEPRDGDVADGLLEKHLLDGGGADGVQGGQQQEELSKSAGLSWVPGGGQSFPKGQKCASLGSAQPAQVVHSCDK